MKITTKVKQFLLDNGYANADATDAELQEAFRRAAAEGAVRFKTVGDETQPEEKKSLEEAIAEARAGGLNDDQILLGVDFHINRLERARDTIVSKLSPEVAARRKTMSTVSNPNVSPESQKYRGERRTLKHKSGHEILVDGKTVEEPSERDLARAGVFIKQKIRQQAGVTEPLPAHEQALLREVAHTSLFAGPDVKASEGWSDPRKLRDHEVKALLNDSTSGGEWTVPLEYDMSIVSFAQLHSELFGLVDQRTASHASIRTTTFGNVEVLWNDSVDAGSATEFDTEGLIGKIDTAFHALSFKVTMGRDFLSDSHINVMSELQREIGQAMLKELDKVIAVGNGSTQPEGIFTKTGVTAVNSAMGINGPVALGDLARLYFAVPKQNRVQSNRLVYACGDALYAKFRQIPVGSDNAIRVLGMDQGSYYLNDQPCKIQNDIPGGYIAYAAMAKYRFWRRLGLETRFTDQGAALFNANKAMMIVRGRFGGKVIDTTCFAKMTNAENNDNPL